MCIDLSTGNQYKQLTCEATTPALRKNSRILTCKIGGKLGKFCFKMLIMQSCSLFFTNTNFLELLVSVRIETHCINQLKIAPRLTLAAQCCFPVVQPSTGCVCVSTAESPGDVPQWALLVLLQCQGRGVSAVRQRKPLLPQLLLGILPRPAMFF